MKDMEKETIEGNKLIVEFMGATYYKKQKWYQFKKWSDAWVFPNTKYIGFCDEHLKYHSSWDWLMPVVEKIKNLGFYYKLTEWQFFIFKYSDYSGVIAYDSKTEIDEHETERVFKTIIRFIKWYNQSRETNSG